MTKWLHQIKQSRKLLLALVVAGIIAIPVGVTAYAQSGNTNDEITQEVDKEVVTDPEVTDEEVPQITPVVQEEIVPTPQTPTEEPVVDPATEVTLAEAQVIAEAEHTGSTVVSTKTKTMDGATVYVFVFADNWKVYVGAADGTVLKVKDPGDKEHSCNNTFKKEHGANFRSDARGVSSNRDHSNSHNSHNNGRGHSNGHHRH